MLSNETIAALNSPSNTRKRLRAMPFSVRYSIFAEDGTRSVDGSAPTWEDAREAVDRYPLKGTVQSYYREDYQCCPACGRKVA